MRYLCTIISLLIVLTSSAQDTSLFKREVFIKGKDSLRYRLLYPTKYDVNKKYPVVLFLHGAGERGNDNAKQLFWGASLFLDSANRGQYPAFVIFPQCPENGFWANIKRDLDGNADSLGNFVFNSQGNPSVPMQLVMKLIDSLSKTAQADPDRIYVGGLSMGGMGTFEILWRKPDFFAGAFAICGGGDPAKVAGYAKDFPIWVFHGASDNVVPVSNSRLMVNTLKAAGAKVKYSEYPGVGHDSWKNAFAEPDFLEWLFEQKK
jgi:predicted peptidase